MMGPGPIIYKIVKRIKGAFAYALYNEYTIANYLRKQGAQIGQGCVIYVRSVGTEPYLVEIGDNVSIAGGVLFATHDGAAAIFKKEIPNIQVFGRIIIEDNCVIGHHAMLFPDVRIGKNSIVGAASVVISDIPPNTIAMGIPARPMGSIEKYKEKCIAKWEEQRPPDIIIEPGRHWWNSKHYKENREKLRRHLTKLYGIEVK